jgi:hypothetical protein
MVEIVSLVSRSVRQCCTEPANEIRMKERERLKRDEKNIEMSEEQREIEVTKMALESRIFQRLA